MIKKPSFSVIIPVRSITKYLRENIKILQKNAEIEILVVTDKISNSANPAKKRNIGAKKAKADILVFLDDDSYPNKDFFLNAKKIFSDQNIVAACGPQLTPKDDNTRQQASGLILSSWLGSGGAGSYRNKRSTPRFLDDYPSVNLLVRKSTFALIGGFDTSYWPGEDTLFCRQLKLITSKQIYYSPDLTVFHHRRPVGFSFLKQHSRYGMHRGYFAKKYPENSAKMGYFLPTIFLLYLLFLPLFYQPIFTLPLVFYLFCLTLQFFMFIFTGNNIFVSMLAIIFIPPTHLVYGIFFIFGLLKSKINFQPHKIDSNGNYIGG